MGVDDKLLAGVIYDLLIVVDGGVEFSGLCATTLEETVTQLHDVRLVDARHLLTVVLQRVVERELRDTHGLLPGNCIV